LLRGALLDPLLLVLAQVSPRVWAQERQDKQLLVQPVEEPRITVCTKPFSNTSTVKHNRSSQYDEHKRCNAVY
jgi:hypothetical protein